MPVAVTFSLRHQVRAANRRAQGELKAEMAGLRADKEKGFKEQTRWMFLAWASLLIPIIGLWMRG